MPKQQTSKVPFVSLFTGNWPPPPQTAWGKKYILHATVHTHLGLLQNLSLVSQTVLPQAAQTVGLWFSMVYPADLLLKCRLDIVILCDIMVGMVLSCSFLDWRLGPRKCVGFFCIMRKTYCWPLGRLWVFKGKLQYWSFPQIHKAQTYFSWVQWSATFRAFSFCMLFCATAHKSSTARYSPCLKQGQRCTPQAQVLQASAMKNPGNLPTLSEPDTIWLYIYYIHWLLCTWYGMSSYVLSAVFAGTSCIHCIAFLSTHASTRNKPQQPWGKWEIRGARVFVSQCTS